MSSDKPFFIVAGAGRSGTSAVARVLHESGVSMGREMAAASEVNPEGFYEDLDIVALNERILTDLGMNNPWRPERWPSREAVRNAGAAYRDEMSALARDGVDGWKDPRFAITLEAWLPALGSKPKVIVSLRSPQAYANSATRIYGLVKPARAMREWARHYRRLLAVIRRHNLSTTCVEYDTLIEQPVEAVAGLARFVGRPLDASYVVPRLRREFAPVPETYRTLYERVATLAGSRVENQGSSAQADVRQSETSVKREGSRARVATPGYDRVVGKLVERLVQAKDTWESAVQMPSFELNDDAQAACESYSALLIRAQHEVAALVPLAKRGRSHTELVRRINIERMIAELSRAAASNADERTRDAAIRAWRRYGRTVIALC